MKACDHASWHVNDSNDAGICDTCGIELVKFYGTSLSIGESLEMTFYVQSYIDDTSSWIVDFTRFGFVEKDGVVSEDATANKSDVSGTGISNNLIAYKYTGINPQCMTTPINATLKCGEGKELTATDTVYNYCARANAMPGTTDMQKQLIADMLNFGAAAQEYRDWHGELTYNDETKTIILANTGSEVADLMEHARKDYTAPVNITAKLSDITRVDGWKIKSANMNFAFDTKLLFNIEIPDEATGATVEITNSNKNATQNIDITKSSAVSITVKPWEYGDVYIAKLKDSDNVVDGVQYSVDSYISKQYQNDTKLGKLMKMLYLYSQSAKEIKGQ